MARMCFMFEIFEGKEAEYKKRHDEIWPELVTAIKDAGFKNYSLFRRGVHVIGYFEVEPDVKTAFEKLGKSEANAACTCTKASIPAKRASDQRSLSTNASDLMASIFPIIG